MKVIEKEEGKPEIAVVACMHGDETSGKKAIDRFLESDFEILKAVKFIIANEKAMEQGERFIDTDLNRCFPGDRESDRHEEVLASKLMEELEGLKSLTLHAMKNFEEMFCLVNGIDQDLITAPGVGKAVDVGPLDEDSVEKYLDAVSVETGPIGSEKAEENAYEVMLNFLSHFGAIEGKSPEGRPEIFQMYDVVDGNYEFLAENFERVEEGEKFAEKDEEELGAEEPFYPILMSTDGYDGILGFKGKKLPEENKRSEVNN